jgi:hypothetical protein
MSRDYGEMEQEFIAGLKADTGRDLAEWMSAINAQTFGHRNDMIDWLRQQNFTFSKASWLERIHHNGGKPIYGERPAAKAREPREVKVAAEPMRVQIASIEAPVRPAPKVEVPVPPPQPPQTAARPVRAAVVPDALPMFLAKAKGYRPLAEMLLRQIRNAAPATIVEVHDSHATLGAPAVYGALTLTAKDIRLSLDLGDQPQAGDVKRARLPGTPANLTHTIALNDARRVNYELMSLITVACKRANP